MIRVEPGNVPEAHVQQAVSLIEDEDLQGGEAGQEGGILQVVQQPAGRGCQDVGCLPLQQPLLCVHVRSSHDGLYQRHGRR